jgi:outer membrane protein OmpA-like peptidoglycan-associated protein
LVVVAFVLLARRRRVLVAILLAVPAAARAQDLDTQLFRPPATSGGVASVDGVTVPPHLAVAAATYFAYTRQPLVARQEGSEQAIVDGQLDAQLAVSVGLASRVELGVIAPFVLSQTPMSGPAAGDLRVEGKLRVLARDRFALALAAGVGLPTGTRDGYYADAAVTFRPRAVAGGRLGRVDLLAQLGAVLGRSRIARDLDIGAQLAYGAAARARLGGGVAVFAALNGLVTPGGGAGSAPAELLAGPELRLRRIPLELSLAAGRGLNDGYGTPSLRVLLSARWVPVAPPAPPIVVAAAPVVLERAVEPLPVDPPPREPPPEPPPPPPADDGLTEVTDEAIVLKRQVFFATGKAIIQPRSFPLLASVARQLQAHPEIALVRIEGHTDDRGRRARNLALSQARAEAVRAHLVEIHGIDASRLIAQGFGPDRPVASNRTTAGRARNRRSELVIVERKPR